MRFHKKIITITAAAVILLSTMIGCKEAQDDKKNIIAIWQLQSIMVNGMEIGDGKGYLHFKEDGTVISRTGPAIYDDGKYTLVPEKRLLTMSQDSIQQNYQYALVGDSLSMTVNEGGRTLVLKGKRVAELPIKRIDDVPAENIFH